MIREMGRDALAEAPLALDITNHTPFAGDDSRTTGKGQWARCETEVLPHSPIVLVYAVGRLRLLLLVFIDVWIRHPHRVTPTYYSPARLMVAITLPREDSATPSTA
jgi:hypothetical protein